MAQILVGIRTGDVLDGEIVESWEADPNNPMGPTKVVKYNFKFEALISGHSSLQINLNQKKIHLSCNQRFPIFVTVSDDETIRLWDIRRRSTLMT
jgi:WD40 repeat protein